LRNLRATLILFFIFFSFALPLGAVTDNQADDCMCGEELGQVFANSPRNKSILFAREIFPPDGYTDVVAVFSTRNCAKCKKLIYDTIPEISKKLNKKTYVEFFALDNPVNYEMLSFLLKDKNLDGKLLPVIVGEANILFGDNRIENELKHLLKKGSDRVRLYQPSDSAIQEAAVKELKQFKIYLIAAAGLIDGINPCAFATIIFLISYLSVQKISRKNILYSGIFFTLGVFTLYFFIGIGLYGVFVRFFENVLDQIDYLKLILGIVMLVLFALSVYDVFVLLFKKKNDLLLQLPKSYKLKIHEYIRISVKHKHLVVFSFFLGMAISSIELACTGQIYFPTIMYLIKEKAYFYNALFYLCLYNFAFIIPLILVFLLVYYGLSIGQIEKLFKQHLWINKLLLAVVFLSLAIIFLH